MFELYCEDMEVMLDSNHRFPNIIDNGWTESGFIIWIESVLPENIVDILLNKDENEDVEW